MGIGIIICDLNGSGKSTLGKALAEKLDFYFVDNDNNMPPTFIPLNSYPLWIFQISQKNLKILTLFIL